MVPIFLTYLAGITLFVGVTALAYGRPNRTRAEP
jgi:hypothetical protein